MAIAINPIHLALVGFGAGMVSSLLGLGGGVVMIPALTLLLKLDAKRAVYMSLLAILAISPVGAIGHYISDPSNLRLQLLLPIVAGTLLGSFLGSKLSQRISVKWLNFIFAIICLLAALKLMMPMSVPDQAIYFSQDASQAWLRLMSLTLLGILVGILASNLGIGGGVVIIPFLSEILLVEIHAAIATSLAVIFPSTLIVIYFYPARWRFPLSSAKSVFLPAMLGALVGSALANHLPAQALRYAFASVLVYSAYKLFVQYRGIKG